MQTNFYWNTYSTKHHLEEGCVEETIVLIWILNKYMYEVMTCSIDRNTEAIGGPVNTVILISVAQE
jgi:hypothetical protein